MAETVPKAEETGKNTTPDSQTPTPPEPTVEDIKVLLEKLKAESEETKAAVEEWRKLYNEMLENMSKEEQKETPSFEEFLRFLFDEAKRKAKYPYYYYAYSHPHYYYPYPKKGRMREEELPEGQGATTATETEETKLREKYSKIAEALRKGERIREQWFAPIVKAERELVGNVRDFVKVDTLLEGKPGDVVNIATVRDFDLGAWGTYGGATLQDETATDVIAFSSATVQEAGVKFYMKKALVEKADANVVELVNGVCRRAVLRAEDKKVLEDIYNTTGILSLDKSGATVNFDADWIAEIISAFATAGVSVDPGDLVLFIEPAMHEALLKDIAGAMGLVFARPDVVQKGTLTEFMGVTIRVVSHSILPNDGTKTFAIAFKKGSYTLAPKREFSVETDPDPANRRTLTVVTVACAGLLANPKYGLKLKTPLAA